MLTRSFWVDAGERVVRTVAQTLLALLGTGAVGILAVDWLQMLSVAAGAGLVSLLMSIVATGVGAKGTAEFVEVGK
ncbi:Holin, r1t-type [uncultured Caudovirales phage]|uniref:Holin, r1t-type n=1 Tax=uncultured Caudovirales phage TaxID=2100421 RepID=A0A6J5LK69_9CAUD|nr:Holin, r1t-type [uncultured Caudovirales phage]CAB4173713.1 Holin, r1t-type [uncultured Caudovirales phage]CAB4192478.1 Holin, r1t-type [uncultured Caudovirales phage]